MTKPSKPQPEIADLSTLTYEQVVKEYGRARHRFFRGESDGSYMARLRKEQFDRQGAAKASA